MLEELIKVKNENGKLLVSARELYEGLELNISQYARWVKKNILENEYFKENEDFILLDTKSNENKRGNFAKDYAITLEFAKHLCMMARTEKSHKYRNYFIQCEQFIQESNLSEEFKYFRETGKTVRKELADTIQESLDPNDTHKMGNYTNLIYKSIFGRNAKQMKVDRGLVKSDNLRDSLTSEELGKVLKTEERVKGYINTFVDMGLEYKEIYKKVKELLLK